MARHSSEKVRRQQLLKQKLKQDPFLTDGELARLLGVSIPTIRLDRMTMGIPELRERVLNVAETSFDAVKTLEKKEFVGELLDINLGSNGTSVMTTSKEMCFEKSSVVRGHYIYSMAECLAIAIIDAPVALVGVANIKYHIPVEADTKLVARGEVKSARGNQSYVVWVKIYGNQTEVFRGKFILDAKQYGIRFSEYALQEEKWRGGLGQ